MGVVDGATRFQQFRHVDGESKKDAKTGYKDWLDELIDGGKNNTGQGSRV